MPVQQHVLNWLYSVLTSEYHDVNRCYDGVARVLNRYPSLSPRTDVYTYPDGSSALLVHLSGTIPVNFRGSTYRFPLSIWIPHSYPREPPLIYVTPTETMVIRPGQHVDPQGQVYHPYLVGWAQFWDKSTLQDFLAILADVFAKEPPVVARQQRQAPGQTPVETPPPVPPLPPEVASSPVQLQRQSQPNEPQPPPPPPKSPTDSRSSSGPPRPPLPPTSPSNSTQSRVPSRYESAPPLPPQAQHGDQRRVVSPPEQRMHDPRQSAYHQGVSSPHQGQPMPGQALPPYSQQQWQQPGPPPGWTQQNSAMPPFQAQPQTQHQYQSQQQQPQHPQQVPHTQLAPQQAPPARQPQPQLLDDPLTIDIPPPSTVKAPPIPPNPEKDALLRQLAQTLASMRQHSRQQNESSLSGLQAQRSAMLTAMSGLQSELGQLTQLSNVLSSNASILHEALRKADGVIEDSSRHSKPDIDELLVAPTVVSNQLYNLVAEERALGDAIFMLGRAVEREKIQPAVFAKMTRSFAREWYLKKALARKIAEGMGMSHV